MAVERRASSASDTSVHHRTFSNTHETEAGDTPEGAVAEPEEERPYGWFPKRWSCPPGYPNLPGAGAGTRD